MINNLKHIVLCTLFALAFFQVSAQTDTIFIYEDVIVYDTIIIYDTVIREPITSNISYIDPKSISLLQIDSINQQVNLILISKEQTATFPINHIIHSENIKNLKSMKKLSFFGIVFFAFQTMVLAQTNYEVSIGSGIWWQNGMLNNIDKPYSPLINAGFYAKRNFIDKNFGLKTGIGYSYLIPSKDYKFDGTLGIYHTDDGSEFIELNQNYNAGMHNITIPLLLYYDRFFIQPCVGINYNLLVTLNEETVENPTSYNKPHNFGLNFGLDFKINETFAISTEYKRNLTADFGQNPEFLDNAVLGRDYSLNNSQVLLSIVYSF